MILQIIRIIAIIYCACRAVMAYNNNQECEDYECGAMFIDSDGNAHTFEYWSPEFDPQEATEIKYRKGTHLIIHTNK